MKKKKEPYCKNCLLFNPKKKECQVVIIHEGEKYNLPVEPNDYCFFENTFVANSLEFDKQGNFKGVKEEKFKVDVQEIRCWVENPLTGEKTDKNGIVKIQCPETLDIINDEPI